MQGMALDGASSDTNTQGVALGEAIALALASRPDPAQRTEKWLAERIGLDASGVNRMIKGRLAAVTLERVRKIEEVLELRPGTLLIAAGYVEGIQTVEDALEADGTLPRSTKDVLRAALDAARKSPR